MNSGMGRMADRLPGTVDIADRGTAEGRDFGNGDFFGDFRDRFKITFGSGRKSGFNNIHPEFFKLGGKPHFFSRVHAGAWGLFAVSQCSVEDKYFFDHGSILKKIGYFLIIVSFSSRDSLC